MTTTDDYSHTIELLRAAADPVAAMHALVVASGGTWADDVGHSLFEIHFLGIAGTAPGRPRGRDGRDKINR